jgi:hypothetical protein
MDPMRRLIALSAVVVLTLSAASGCRHVGGACDCDHASAAAPAAGCASGNCGKAAVVPAAAATTLPRPSAYQALSE